MKLPKSFNDITIKQYQVIYDLLIDKTLEIEDRWVRILSEISGESIKFIENLPRNEMVKYFKQLSFLEDISKLDFKAKQYLKLKGKVYKMQLFANKLTTSQAIEIKTFLLRNDGASSYHEMLASMALDFKMLHVEQFEGKTKRSFACYKYRSDLHKQRADAFLTAKVGDVYGTLFFYSKVWENSMPILEDFSSKAIKVIQKRMKEMNVVQNVKNG